MRQGRRWAPWGLVIAVLACCGGCRSALVEWSRLWDGSSSALSDPEVLSLANVLSRDQWRPEANWSPLHEYAYFPVPAERVSRTRWQQLDEQAWWEWLDNYCLARREIPAATDLSERNLNERDLSERDVQERDLQERRSPGDPRDLPAKPALTPREARGRANEELRSERTHENEAGRSSPGTQENESPHELLAHDQLSPEWSAQDEMTRRRVWWEISQLKDVRGYNAAILWGLHDPVGARSIESVLAKLVTAPPLVTPLPGSTQGTRPGEPIVRGSSHPVGHAIRPNVRGDAQRLVGSLTSTVSPVSPASPAAPQPANSAGTGGVSGGGKPVSKGTATRAETKAATPQPQPLSLFLRCAAAQAWCQVLVATADDREASLAPAGRALQQLELPPEVRAELVRGIARHIPPSRIPGLLDAVRGPAATSNSPQVVEQRRLVLEACLLYAVHQADTFRPPGLRVQKFIISGQPGSFVAVEPRRHTAGRDELDEPSDGIFTGFHGTTSTTGTTRTSGPAAAAGPSHADLEAYDTPADEQGSTSPRDLEWWSQPHVAGLFPPEVWEWPWDADAKVRRRLGELLAVLAHPRAFDVLTGQLQDKEATVRDAALVHLGLLGTPEALRELDRQLQKTDDRTRKLAVRGLAGGGAGRLISLIRTSPSVAVRAEAVRRLAPYPGPLSARVLQELVADPQLEVQLAIVSAVESWPRTWALCVLVPALVESSPKTRSLAYRQVTARVREPLGYRLDADIRERATWAAHWTQVWQLPQTGLVEPPAATRGQAPASRTGSSRPSAARSRTDRLRLAEIREHLDQVTSPRDVLSQQQARLWFQQQLTASDVPLLEETLAQVTPDQHRFLWDDVLPGLSPIYRAVWELSQREVTTRTKGARMLSDEGRRGSLSPLILGRLADLLVREQDKLVWRYVMQGVHEDASDEAAHIAWLALHNPWPDVRVLGCEYVGRHQRPQQALWVMPLLYDPNSNVQLASVVAAGKCRNPLVLDSYQPPTEPLAPQAPPAGIGGASSVATAATTTTTTTATPATWRGLRPLLTEAQGQIRFATVVAMSSLGDGAALQELTRLSFDPNPLTRSAAAQAMGDTQQTRFIEPLIRLLWTENQPQVRHAALQSLRRLVPPEQQPAGLDRIPAPTPSAAVELWAAWWNQRQSAPSGESQGETAGRRPVKAER